jgi:hypothetical protein
LSTQGTGFRRLNMSTINVDGEAYPEQIAQHLIQLWRHGERHSVVDFIEQLPPRKQFAVVAMITSLLGGLAFDDALGNAVAEAHFDDWMLLLSKRAAGYRKEANEPLIDDERR